MYRQAKQRRRFTRDDNSRKSQHRRLTVKLFIALSSPEHHDGRVAARWRQWRRWVGGEGIARNQRDVADHGDNAARNKSTEIAGRGGPPARPC